MGRTAVDVREEEREIYQQGMVTAERVAYRQAHVNKRRWVKRAKVATNHVQTAERWKVEIILKMTMMENGY